jgi:hypothetical protein
MNIADMAITVFHAESGLLRAMKADANKHTQSTFFDDIVRTYLYNAADLVNKSGKDAINAFATGDEQRMLLLGLKRFTKAEPFNSKDARRRIASALIKANKYNF